MPMTMMILVMASGDDNDDRHAFDVKPHPRSLACLRLQPGPCSPERERSLTSSMVFTLRNLFQEVFHNYIFQRYRKAGNFVLVPGC